MIIGQEFKDRIIHLLSVEGQPTKAVLAQKCIGVFYIS
jgi:hypothetical protein